MSTYRSTSKTRPSQVTLDQRAAFDRQFDHAQIVANIPHLWSVVANVAKMQLDATRNDWVMVLPHDWVFERDGDLCAEVEKSRSENGYMAFVWYPNDYSECDIIESGYDAMCWCIEKLQAAALNAKAERLERTGAED